MLGLPAFVDVYFISVLAFIGLLAVVIYKDRKNIQFYYVLMIRRTHRGEKAIDRIAKLSPKIWRFLSTIFVMLAFYFMAYSLYMMGFAAKLIIDRTIKTPSIQFVVPMPFSQPSSGPGYLLVPFWFWIILIPFFMFPHEIAHGIIARAHKIRLKSVGVMLLAIIPGAFVEPDEKQLAKAKPLVKLRIFSAGSMANIACVALVMLVASQLIWPSIVQNGLMITEVNNTLPVGSSGLAPGMVLEKINGQPVNVEYGDFQISYSLLLITSSNITVNNSKIVSTYVAMQKILGDYKPGDVIDVVASGRHYRFELSPHPLNASIPYMGLTLEMGTKKDVDFEFSTLLPLVWWLTTVGNAVALFNLLPLYPLDGGLMVEAVAEKILGKGKKSKLAAKTIAVGVLALLVFNFIGPYILSLF